MSTAKRRRGHSLHLDLPASNTEGLPPISATFFIRFDAKAGYTIAWRRSIPGLELDESVEFKSLPSGLHNVSEDIIYFTHGEEYVGISAFENRSSEESERNAVMIAVGVLVPCAGRSGKSWRYANILRDLAKNLSKDPTKTDSLENFWSEHKAEDDGATQEQCPQPTSSSTPALNAERRQSQTSPNAQQGRRRALTAASAFVPSGQSLPPHHPALSLTAFLNCFGPLIFPLYKAALLRKRILLVGQAPVELACNYVYDISILSGIPSSVSDFIPLEPISSRLRPLFAVGVHDMQTLSQGSRKQHKDSELANTGMGYGWVANTTDDILSLKDQLYDVLITLPPAYSENAKVKVWPKLEVKKGSEIKATQRDLRRYRTLRNGLRRFPTSCSPHASRQSASDDPTTDLPFTNAQETYDDASSTLDAQLAEPQSWSALAYDSFMWWASAGEKRTDLDEEEEYDAALIPQPDRYDDDTMSPSQPRTTKLSPGRNPNPEEGDTQSKNLEVTLIAYFHRLTTLILKTLSDIIDSSHYSDSDHNSDPHSNPNPNPNPNTNTETTPLTPTNKQTAREEEDEEMIYINSEDMSRMGLDIWSESDREFVRELVGFYWGRRAEVSGGRVDCCGVRIC